MAKRKVKSEAQRQYEKELKRIKQFIRRAEKRGYRFPDNVIPPKPKRITRASVSRLQKIKPQTLYKKATALSESGKIVSGTERRAEERRASAVKGARTRKARERQRTASGVDFETERRRQDEEEQRRLREDEAFRRKFEEGEIVYNMILEAIADIDKYHKRAAEHVKEILDREIATYGRDAVLRTIGETPGEVLELAEIALRYNPGDSRHDNAVNELVNIIRGTVPTAEEMREMQDILDEDGYTDDVG